MRGIGISSIVITEHVGNDLAERCIATSAMTFLSKPLQAASLFAAFDEAHRINKNGTFGSAF